jgi:hypothetical protein
MNGDQGHDSHLNCMKHKKVIMYAVCVYYGLDNSGIERPYVLELVSYLWYNSHRNSMSRCEISGTINLSIDKYFNKFFHN